MDLADIVLCDLMARLVKNVADVAVLPGRRGSHVVAKTSYVHKIIRTYRAVYGGRLWRRQPQHRRGAGVPRVSHRAKRAGTELEAVFVRKRAREVEDIMAEKPEDRASKRRRTAVGGAIPEDTQAYVTDAIRAVREKALKIMQNNKRVNAAAGPGSYR